MMMKKTQEEMTLTQETKIVKECVKKAARQYRYRKDAAELAARLAHKKGVNVIFAPYIQNIFYDALDECDFEPNED